MHYLSSRSYEWIVEADIEACFDELDHAALLDRVRQRIKDKRVLGLVKAFLHAGILTEHGGLERPVTGTPQGGILSPLMANIALSALDEHFAEAWQAMGDKWHSATRPAPRRGDLPARPLRRRLRRLRGRRPASRRELIARTEQVLAPLGLTLSREKTRVTHIDEGIDFLGLRIKRQPGRHGHRYVYTPTRPGGRSRPSRRRSGRSRGPATTRRSTSCCTGSTRC